MTAEPVVEQPKHPVYALTTYELRDYRRQLEHALRVLPGHVEIRIQLEQRLDQVLAEEAARLRGAAGT